MTKEPGNLKTYFWIGVVIAIVLVWAFSQPKDHSMDRRAGETVTEHQVRIDRAEAAGPEEDVSGGSHEWQ